jgi:hypothetical protein
MNTKGDRYRTKEAKSFMPNEHIQPTNQTIGKYCKRAKTSQIIKLRKKTFMPIEHKELLMDFKLKSQNVYAMELKLVKLHK